MLRCLAVMRPMVDYVNKKTSYTRPVVMDDSENFIKFYSKALDQRPEEEKREMGRPKDEDIRKHLFSQENINGLFVAEKDGKIVGYARNTKTWPKELDHVKDSGAYGWNEVIVLNDYEDCIEHLIYASLNWHKDNGVDVVGANICAHHAEDRYLDIYLKSSFQDISDKIKL